MLGKKARMLATPKLMRSLGIASCLGGGLTGALLLAYQCIFPPAPTLSDLVLVTALLGAALYQLLVLVVVRRFSFYLSLLELYLVRRLIGEQARAEITRALAFMYFLGDSTPPHRGFSSKAGKKSSENTVQTVDGAVGEGANGAARGDGSAAY